MSVEDIIEDQNKKFGEMLSAKISKRIDEINILESKLEKLKELIIKAESDRLKYEKILDKVIENKSN